MKTIISIVAICFLTSCKHSYTVVSSKETCMCYCTKAQFVANEQITLSSENTLADLTLAGILKSARARLGGDVSVQNVHWDVANGKRVSVVYDVVRCNALAEEK